MGEEKYLLWKNPFDDIMTAEVKEQYDESKIRHAQSMGYDVLEVWDSMSKEEILSIILEKINEHSKEN